jgi:DNA mismatch repair protein MutS
MGSDRITGVSNGVSPAAQGPPRMPSWSILFGETGPPPDVDKTEAPEFFADLHLDQAIASITAGCDEYNLKPFFYVPLKTADAIRYRHEIFRDLEDAVPRGYVRSFAGEMRSMRNHLAQSGKLHYKREKESWFLDAVEIYCGAVQRLCVNLGATGVRSRGLAAFRGFLENYTGSAEFIALAADTERLRKDLSGLCYTLHIHGKRVVVGKYASEPDYGAEVLRTFEKFKRAAPKEYHFNLHSLPDMNHVEAAILDLVAQLYPDIFSFLDEYCTRHQDFLDPTIARFDREVQFYLACLDHMEQFKTAGLAFCYPAVTERSKEVYARESFDLALAHKLIGEKSAVVTNDFYLKDPERILVVSGPNQGGKTTFARTFGQLHYLASVGCPVPGREAGLFLFDRLFTHFEKEEDIRTLTGKLEDELLRIREILDLATPDSILIMNESFLSTTLSDALFLGRQIMERIIALDMLCVSVTFLDELSSLSETTVSMVSTVDPRDPALRTFKVVRKPADGLAYAAAIAEKYGLSYGGIRAKIAEKSREHVA